MLDQGPVDRFDDVKGEEAQRVISDVALGIQPEQSVATYTVAMLRYRKAIEREVAEAPAGAIIDVPADLPPENMKVPEYSPF